MKSIKILFNELQNQNKSIYYSGKDNNIKIVYIKDEKIETNNKYYIFKYNYNNNIKKHYLLLSQYPPQQLQQNEYKNTEIITDLVDIIQKNNNDLSTDEIFKTINYLFSSLTEETEKRYDEVDQEIIIEVLSDEPELFNIIYNNNIQNNKKNRYLYLSLSNGLKTSEKTIYLLNNTYAEEYKLIIKDNVKNTIEKKIQLPFKDIHNLSENDNALLIGFLSPHIEYDEITRIFNTMIDEMENNFIDNITDPTILSYLSKIENKMVIDKKQKETEKNNHLIQSITSDINIILNNVYGEDNPKNLNKSDLSKCLAKFLSLKYGMILRSNVNTAHFLNKENNCYEITNYEEILSLLAQDFGHNNISMDNVKKASTYIDNRPKPDYNIIRFDNCIYDMKTHDLIKLDNPTLPYFDIYFNYNPNAKGELIQSFLYTSLNEKQVKGLLELIGYLFTVGNKENIIICFIGKGGSGKSVLSNILRYLFKRVSNLPIHNLNKDHETSILENKLLNICNDTDNKKIKDNGTFKQLTGGDSLHINPKYREPYIMPPEEVPYFIIVGNQFPKFEKLEIPIIERLMLIEFKKGFRNTKEQKKNLYEDIIKNNDNIEWLIYNSLKAYKEMEVNNESFTLKKTTEENLDLYYKHSNPLLWIIKKLVVFDNDLLITSDIEEHEIFNHVNCYISVDELKQNILKYANEEGLDIGLTENNKLSTKKLTNTLKSAFDLWDMKYNIGFEYKPIQKRENNNRIYVYPNIKFKKDMEN